MIPVLLITGFLGAGKTTLLRRLVLDARQRNLRTALIINEFGAVDIDGGILRAMEADVLAAISGGCACCSGQDEFLSALLDVASRPEDVRPEVVLVEASGLADALLLLETMAAPEALAVVRPQLLITVMDGAGWHAIPVGAQDLVARQVALADWLIVNKVDLCRPEQVQAVVSELQAANQGARIVATAEAVVDMEALWASVLAGSQKPADRSFSGPPAVPDARSPSHGGAHAVVCAVPHPAERARVEAALRELPANVWRAKGFLRLRGETGLTLLQFTGGGDGRWRFAPFILPPGMEEPPLQMVFLGQGLDEGQIKRKFGGHALSDWM